MGDDAKNHTTDFFGEQDQNSISSFRQVHRSFGQYSSDLWRVLVQHAACCSAKSVKLLTVGRKVKAGAGKTSGSQKQAFNRLTCSCWYRIQW